MKLVIFVLLTGLMLGKVMFVHLFVQMLLVEERVLSAFDVLLICLEDNLLLVQYFLELVLFIPLLILLFLLGRF